MQEWSSQRTTENESAAARNLNALRMEEILDASPDYILCLDRRWCFTFVNRAMRELVQMDDLLGACLWTRFPGNLLEPFASNYRRSMEDRVPVTFEAYAPSQRRWLKINAHPVESGIAIQATDITDRKLAETVREAANSRLKQVFEATTDAVVSLDRDFNYTFVNHHATTLLGRSDLVGKNVWREFPSTSADAYLRKTMEQRVPCEFETHNPLPLDRWFRVQTRPSEDGIVVFFRDVTEERAAKQGLLDQQATLAFVQETARVATWEIDLTSEAMSFGSGSFPVFGRPCAEMRTIDDFRRIVHPDDLPLVRARMAACAVSGEVCVVDYRVTALDGGVLWLEGRGRAVYDEHGAPTRWRGMTTDITERKKNEERLRESEEQYRVLADLNPQTLWMGSPDGAVTYVNQGHLEYRGVTADELQGAGWIEGFHPEDARPTLDAWSHSIRTGEEYAMEARIRRGRDGAFRWWSLRALPVRDNSGAISKWLGVAYDIHESKINAERLREQQIETERQRAELETVYRTAPIGLALFDPEEFRYLRLNDRQAEIVGLPCEQILGRTLTEIAPIAGLREMFEQVAAGRPVVDQLLEGSLATRPDEHRFWNVNYFPVYGADGTVQAISAASLEITRQKKSERALIQSEKLAAVGRLASSISQEINNPLEAITNLLYILGTDPALPASSRGFVEVAQNELARVSQIATQTLRFHRQAVDRTRVTAAELVNSVLNLYQGRLGNSGIAVEAAFASATPILCFENDIRQVLNNLIANAIDAMRTGGRLVVRAHDSRVGARPAVRITVADTGHGMSAETAARIFEPFYTTKDLNGTGLGLWISAGIVEHHAGRLRARSRETPGRQGTVFTLVLPV